MYHWRIIATALVVALGVWPTMNGAAAQTFDERWSPVPKAHALPGPAPQPQNDPAPAEPRAHQPARSPSADGSSENGVQASSERQVQQRTAAPEASSTVTPTRPSRRKAVFVGRASYYAYRGGRTASGQSFDAQTLTAAHRTLPFGTRLRVTDLKTRKSVNVVITDRGPALLGRVLDLSYGAAKALGIEDRGVVQVRAEVIDG
jgi:rare lipoprotein A